MKTILFSHGKESEPVKVLLVDEHHRLSNSYELLGKQFEFFIKMKIAIRIE